MRREVVSDIDRHIARKIRERRIMVGKTQLSVALALGVSYQQQHKYETAINKVPTFRLLEMAKVLNMSFNSFFEGIEGYSQEIVPVNHMLLELNGIFPKLSDRGKETLLNVARSLRDKVDG